MKRRWRHDDEVRGRRSAVGAWAGLAAGGLLLAGLLAASGCGGEPELAKSTPPSLQDGVPPLACGTALPPTPPASVQSGPAVEMTDRQGHVWDISTPVYKYGFKADEFDYGLGVNVMRPISGPDFFAPGDPGYPGAGDDFALVGVELGGEERGYPIEIMSRHEIVNDFIGDAHLAVSY